MTSPLAMSPQERTDFITAAARVGIVVAARTGEAAPLATPVWFAFDAEDGSLRFVTGVHTEKARLLATEPRVTFLVQDEAHPQRFVAAAGVARVSPATDDVRRTIAARYLPPEVVDGFVAATPTSSVVLVQMTPDAWWSSDFGKLALP